MITNRSITAFLRLLTICRRKVVDSISSRQEGGYREILVVAIPLVISSATHTVLTFTDRMFLSWYSADCIAASGPASILSYAIICFFMGTGAYTTALIAQFYGANKTLRITRSLWQGIYFGLISSVFIVLLIPVGRMVINNSGHDSRVISLEISYFTILMYGGGLVVIGTTLSSFFSGQGRTKVIMFITFVSALINILLDYILIFGKLGFPALGIVGAGIATVISHAIVIAILACLVFQKKYRKKFRVHKLYQFNIKIFMKLISFGSPEGFHYFVDIAGFSVFIFFIGSYGSVALAASNIAIFVDMMAFMPMIGIGMATTILVGQYIGKNKKHIAVTVTNNSMKITLIYGTFIGCLFWFFPEFFINFFKGNDESTFSQIASNAIPIFKILPFFLMADSLNIIFGSALSGAGDTKFKMVTASLIVLFLFVPEEFLILKIWEMPVVYGWWWCTFYLLVMGLVYLFRFRQGAWKRISIIS